MLDDEIKDILEKLDANLAIIKLSQISCGKSSNFKKERELRL